MAVVSTSVKDAARSVKLFGIRPNWPVAPIRLEQGHYDVRYRDVTEKYFRKSALYF